MKSDVKLTTTGITVSLIPENDAETLIASWLEGRSSSLIKSGSGVSLTINLKGSSSGYNTYRS